jgi:His-Xaa-Ser system radical SAM maturase HxsC
VIQLTGKLMAVGEIRDAPARMLIKVSTNSALPRSVAATRAFLCNHSEVPDGFQLYLALESNRDFLRHVPSGAATAVLPDNAEYLGDGDILRVMPSTGAYRAVFRARSPHTSILLTERCNHYCLMCSQPPREVNDDWIIEEVERLIPMLPMSAREIGFTGGEPTLYGDRLIRLLGLTKRHLPRTAVHILSNGRRFQDISFAQAYADVKHPDLMVGIPLYSDDPVRHNYVVQADHAFDETIRGILNLKLLKQRVELRIVIHKQTVDRLPQLAEFIARNLLFVDQVALMGLEITGFTKGNLDKLWIDPYDYKETLARAVDILSAYRVPTAVYNHQLCVTSERVRPFCTRSISDWKNEYLPICGSCSVRSECGGFFSSSVKHRNSDHIGPLVHS